MNVLTMQVGNIGSENFELVLALPSSAVPRCSGRVRGSLFFFESKRGASFVGELKAGPGQCAVGSKILWSEITPDVLQKARHDRVEFRLRGDVSDKQRRTAIDWVAAVLASAVQLTEPMAATIRRFAKVSDVHLSDLGVKKTRLNIDITVQSPLRFDVNLIEARCDMEIQGRLVASGVKTSFVIEGNRPTKLRLPVDINHGATLNAAGSTILNLGRAVGRLSGIAKLRVPTGSVDIPIDLPLQVDLVR